MFRPVVDVDVDVGAEVVPVLRVTVVDEVVTVILGGGRGRDGGQRRSSRVRDTLDTA